MVNKKGIYRRGLRSKIEGGNRLKMIDKKLNFKIPYRDKVDSQLEFVQFCKGTQTKVVRFMNEGRRSNRMITPGNFDNVLIRDGHIAAGLGLLGYIFRVCDNF